MSFIGEREPARIGGTGIGRGKGRARIRSACTRISGHAGPGPRTGQVRPQLPEKLALLALFVGDPAVPKSVKIRIELVVARPCSRNRAVGGLQRLGANPRNHFEPFGELLERLGEAIGITIREKASGHARSSVVNLEPPPLGNVPWCVFAELSKTLEKPSAMFRAWVCGDRAGLGGVDFRVC